MGSTSTSDSLPYWLVNVPKDEWPTKCPVYLQNLSEKDAQHLAVRDEDYHFLTWDEVQRIVASNKLHQFFRLPSELRRYRWYCWSLVQSYGSVLNYMLQERLKWKDLTPRSQLPFECEEDYKILRNDWPYGIDGRITHLVVWTKTNFGADESTGEPTLEAKRQIESFVERNFGGHVPCENLLWFKNPLSLRSVGAVEHFHVMMLDADPNFIEHVTNGDVPTCEKVGKGPGTGYL